MASRIKDLRNTIEDLLEKLDKRDSEIHKLESSDTIDCSECGTQIGMSQKVGKLKIHKCQCGHMEFKL